MISKKGNLLKIKKENLSSGTPSVLLVRRTRRILSKKRVNLEKVNSL